eukprot:Rmarinus@m.4042
MRFRCRYKNVVETIEVEQHISGSDFLETICRALKAPRSSIVLGGFPPKRLDLSCAPVSTLLSDGETLLVQSDESLGTVSSPRTPKAVQQRKPAKSSCKKGGASSSLQSEEAGPISTTDTNQMNSTPSDSRLRSKERLDYKKLNADLFGEQDAALKEARKALAQKRNPRAASARKKPVVSNSSSATSSAGGVVSTGSPRPDRETPPKRSRKKKPSLYEMGSKEGIEAALFQAAASKGTDDEGLHFLKASLKASLERHTKQTEANERFRAALAGDYTFTDIDTARRLGDGLCQFFEVEYKPTEKSRRMKKEVIQTLPKEGVDAVVKMVLTLGGDAGRAMLRPMYMAEVSPRTFWNLVRMYGSDVFQAVQSLVPSEEWSVLAKRDRVPSQKAVDAAKQIKVDKS